MKKLKCTLSCAQISPVCDSPDYNGRREREREREREWACERIFQKSQLYDKKKIEQFRRENIQTVLLCKMTKFINIFTISLILHIQGEKYFALSFLFNR